MLIALYITCHSLSTCTFAPVGYTHLLSSQSTSAQPRLLQQMPLNTRILFLAYCGVALSLLKKFNNEVVEPYMVWLSCLSLATLLIVGRMNHSMSRKRRHIAGASGQPGTQRSLRRQDCEFVSFQYAALVIKRSIPQVYSWCSASSHIRVSLRPGIAAIHGDPRTDLSSALRHTPPRISSASSATSVTRTKS